MTSYLTPKEERALAHAFAQRIADLFNEIELADDHGIIVFAEEGRIELGGKYGVQVAVQDSFGGGWGLE